MAFCSATTTTTTTATTTVRVVVVVVVVAVDTSEAGLGDLDIDVICKDTRVATHSQPLGRSHNRYTFVPVLPHNHIVNIKYNFDDVPGMNLAAMTYPRPDAQSPCCHYSGPYLTVPSGWAGCYTCPALRPYQFGPMRNPDVTKGHSDRL